jgi:hypothetical protein
VTQVSAGLLPNIVRAGVENRLAKPARIAARRSRVVPSIYRVQIKQIWNAPSQNERADESSVEFSVNTAICIMPSIIDYQ